MNVRELREALLSLGPEYDESMIIVSEPGMSGPQEATRLITIPQLTNVSPHYSWEIFERVVWLDTGGAEVSKMAENEGWLVPYYNPTLRIPSPLTRTPMEQEAQEEQDKRHVACSTCFGEWKRGRRVPRGTHRVQASSPEFCCHCGAYVTPEATTILGKTGCESLHRVSQVGEEP